MSLCQRRGLACVGVALAAVVVLSGCGGGDSTVTGVPSSETLAPPPGAGSPASRVPATQDSGRYTEAPQSVTSNAPGHSAPLVGARERGYLTALKDKGIKTGVLSESLVAAGNTICRIRTTGGAAQETTTIADAVAGQIKAGGYSDKNNEELSRIIVDSATAQLCP